MTTPPKADDQLIANLLRQVDLANSAVTLNFEHLDAETLALFADGSLVEDERVRAIEHLAACTQCRRVASLLISVQESSNTQSDPTVHEQVTLPKFGSGWHAKERWAVWATAAALLISVGSLLYWQSGNSQLAEARTYRRVLAMLEQSEFDKVKQTVTNAGKSGILSDRLRNLEAEAVRGIPAPIALAYSGRLIDFGYDIGGVVARDPTSLPHRQDLDKASQILETVTSENLEAILNRSHVLLCLGRIQEARTEFQRAVELAPQDALAWLGLGLACFMADDFEGAETAFRQSLQLDAKSIPARFNLAMTLEELGKNAGALAEWRSLLNLPISQQDRQKIELAIEQLLPQSKTPESLK